jgi:bifunctional non-homologous end joining protein LigD
VTCRHRETLAVVGWAEKNKKFDGIYLARAGERGLTYAGKLERGFTDEDKAAVLKRLVPLRTRAKPMQAARKAFPKAHWVQPRVLVDAEFRGLTGDGLLRHPSFKGVRDDLTWHPSSPVPKRAARALFARKWNGAAPL